MRDLKESRPRATATPCGCVKPALETGGAVYLSGIDMIHGTPVLDIKPYIADYDSPQNLIESSGDFTLQNNQHKPKTVSQSEGKTDSCDWQQLSGYKESQPCRCTEKPKCPEDRTSGENNTGSDDTANTQQSSPEPREKAAELGEKSSPRVTQEQSGPHSQEKSPSEEQEDNRLKRGEEAVVPEGHGPEMSPKAPSTVAGAAHSSMVPAWVREAPVANLEVRFTPHAEMDLEHLSSGEPGVGQASFKYFQSAEEARCAIEAVLSADPRSVYRRKFCQDRLFYFTVDTAHVTCWFGDGFAEVLRIKLVSEPVQMSKAAESPVSLGS
ncbi:tRNA (adenine(37)-N6)-methyltransferase isoform X4 [Moschus berezovskii]|uniref:tRNA (adenine(37)-N6)-methyltransferase isoform X4 n=1 Tax=Moschus berezovskii TaxID=68408 RepID=UPI0024440D59|nr:tRNA (adenine(37)-N6)-methyltransferase isoform X4 [Moschus berezovskii]